MIIFYALFNKLLSTLDICISAVSSIPRSQLISEVKKLAYKWAPPRRNPAAISPQHAQWSTNKHTRSYNTSTAIMIGNGCDPLSGITELPFLPENVQPPVISKRTPAAKHPPDSIAQSAPQSPGNAPVCHPESCDTNMPRKNQAGPVLHGTQKHTDIKPI